MIQYTSADNDNKYTAVKLKTRIQYVWQNNSSSTEDRAAKLQKVYR